MLFFINPDDPKRYGRPGEHYVATYRGVPIFTKLGVYRVPLVGRDGGNIAMPRLESEAAAKRFIGFAVKRGAKVPPLPRQNPNRSRTLHARAARSRRRAPARAARAARAARGRNNPPAKKFTAYCDQCYNQRVENVGIREAERFCTSHMNAYGHSCHILPADTKQNPPARRAGVDSSRRRPHLPRRKSRPASDPARSRSQLTSSERRTMAKRGKRRRRGGGGRFVARKRGHSNPPRKRSRRRRSVAYSNPPRHHRRRRRNPDIIAAIGGNATKQGITALGVVAGETLARKGRGALQGMLPTTVNVSSGWTSVAVTAAAALAASIVSTLAPSKFKRAAESLAVGAWAETLNCAIAQTPAAPYFAGRALSAYPQRLRSRRPGVQAWPAVTSGGAGMNAWPTFRAAGTPAGMNGSGY
jgi:hypothetical protein